MGLDMYMEKTNKENIEGLLSLWSITDIFKAAHKYNYYLGIKKRIAIADGEDFDCDSFMRMINETKEEMRERILNSSKDLVERKKNNQLDEDEEEFFTSYEEIRDSNILNKYKEAYDFIRSESDGKDKIKEVAYWRKEYELNGLILDTIIPDTFEGDSNCVLFEVNKQHLEEILNKAQADFDLTDEYAKEKVKDIQRLLTETNFDKEILFYHQWY